MSRYQDLINSFQEKYETNKDRAERATFTFDEARYNAVATAWWDAINLVEQYIGDPRRRSRELLNKEEQE